MIQRFPGYYRSILRERPDAHGCGVQLSSYLLRAKITRRTDTRIRSKSMRNQAESPFTSHSPHSPGNICAEIPAIIYSRSAHGHAATGPPGVCNPTNSASNRPRSSIDAYMHNLCEEFRARSCTPSFARVSGFHRAEIRTSVAIESNICSEFTNMCNDTCHSAGLFSPGRFGARPGAIADSFSCAT